MEVLSIVGQPLVLHPVLVWVGVAFLAVALSGFVTLLVLFVRSWTQFPDPYRQLKATARRRGHR